MVPFVYGSDQNIRQYSYRTGSVFMYKTTVKIDGMMCGMCEAHICDAIRKVVPSAKKVKASRAKKEATFISEASVDPGVLEKVIKDTGYDFLGIESEPYVKKGLFG